MEMRAHRVDFAKLMEAVGLVRLVLEAEPASYTCKQVRPNWDAT